MLLGMGWAALAAAVAAAAVAGADAAAAAGAADVADSAVPPPGGDAEVSADCGAVAVRWHAIALFEVGHAARLPLAKGQSRVSRTHSCWAPVVDAKGSFAEGIAECWPSEWLSCRGSSHGVAANSCHCC